MSCTRKDLDIFYTWSRRHPRRAYHVPRGPGHYEYLYSNEDHMRVQYRYIVRSPGWLLVPGYSRGGITKAEPVKNPPPQKQYK